MSDPLGLIGGAGGASPQMPGRAGGANKPDPQGPSFKDVLRDSIDEVNQLQQDATRAIEDLQTGSRDDVESVLMATQKADLAFQMLLQVRNRVMEAYDEIKQIRV